MIFRLIYAIYTILTFFNLIDMIFSPSYLTLYLKASSFDLPDIYELLYSIYIIFTGSLIEIFMILGPYFGKKYIFLIIYMFHLKCLHVF